MITFRVVKEEYGWAVRMGQRMTTPFWSRTLAVREANCLADTLRRHGECTEVVVEGGDLGASPGRVEGAGVARLKAQLSAHAPGTQ